MSEKYDSDQNNLERKIGRSVGFDVKLTKDPPARRNWRQREHGRTETKSFNPDVPNTENFPLGETTAHCANAVEWLNKMSHGGKISPADLKATVIDLDNDSKARAQLMSSAITTKPVSRCEAFELKTSE